MAEQEVTAADKTAEEQETQVQASTGENNIPKEDKAVEKAEVPEETSGDMVEPTEKKADTTGELPTPNEDLKVPEPPENVKVAGENDTTNEEQSVETTESEETVVKNNGGDKTAAVEGPKEGIVQNHDWNNGKPEVTKEHQQTLDTHKAETPEVENDKELRENKGNKDGEPVLEASEEVTTGQNAG